MWALGVPWEGELGEQGLWVGETYFSLGTLMLLEFLPCACISDSILSPLNFLWVSYLHIKFGGAGIEYPGMGAQYRRGEMGASNGRGRGNTFK